MPVVINPESEYAKELAKFEQHQTKICGDNPPGNPYRFRPYPKMLYKAVKLPSGKVVCMPGEPNPAFYPDVNQFNFAMAQHQAIEQSCYKTVHSDDEERTAKHDGWRESPKEAIEHFEALERDIAKAAAERAFSDQRMSEKARAEAKAADEATDDHVPDVPRKRSKE